MTFYDIVIEFYDRALDININFIEITFKKA